MRYTMTEPCPECPFLTKNAKSYGMRKLRAFAEGAFPCHRTAQVVEDDESGDSFEATPKSQHCAGALIFCEKRGQPNQMMRIAERLGMYDHRRLNMKASVV